MKRTLKTSFIAAVTTATMMASAASAETWRAWNIHSDGHPNTAAMDLFAEMVDATTNGEVKVDVFHGGVLGSQPDALEQVSIGAIELGKSRTCSAFLKAKQATLLPKEWLMLA